MSRSKLPQVIVATPDRSEYYDLTLDLEPLIFTGASIFSTLEGVHQNTLRPRTIESVQNRLFRAMGVKLVAWNVRSFPSFFFPPFLARLESRR